MGRVAPSPLREPVGANDLSNQTGLGETGGQTGCPPLQHTFSERAILITTVQQYTFSH